MTIRPIRNDVDYRGALARVSELLSAGTVPEVGTSERDELDVLTVLIEAYETEFYPIDPPDPVEAILFRMDQEGLSRRDVEERVGLGSGRLSEVLNRRRPLSVNMIRAFHRELGIPAEILVREYPLAS